MCNRKICNSKNQNQCTVNLKQTAKIRFKKAKQQKSKTLKNKLNT